MITESESESERVLFLPENPYDGRTAREVFAEYNLILDAVDTVSDLIDELDNGTGCLLITEEALREPDSNRLTARLRDQPTWSDLPVIIITRADRPSSAAWELTEFANATLAERPLRIETLVSLAQSALRDRRRQYDIRRSIANRDRFMVMLGHELRNPLTAIMLAVEQFSGDETSPTAVDIIRRQSENLERIIDDLLEVSRISRGVIKFDKEPIDLAEVVCETADAFSNIAREQQLQLEVNVPDTPLWVHGDSVRLGQVLGNLLSNAVRYTPEGGRIEMDAIHREETVVISVSDTGIGIPEEMLDSIFDIFTQAHGDTSRQEGGLGLGLGLADRIVAEHDGELIAESPGQGEGSTFSVHLPTTTAPSSAQETSSTTESPETLSSRDTTEECAFLVIHHSDDVRTALEEMLRRHDHLSQGTASTEEAMEAVEATDYDVVLFDVGLPGITGDKLLQRLRDHLPSATLIGLTGYRETTDLGRAREEKLDALLTKPVDMEEIEGVLDSSNDGSQ